MLDFLIIGAGITGITIGRTLQMKGENNFIILESAAEAGGLCRTKKVGKHYLDIGGGHFLCTKYPEIYEFIFSHIPESEFNFFSRVSKIRLGEEIIDYPLESNIWQLPIAKQVEYLISVIQSGELVKKKEPGNYEEWIRWKLGNQIAESYMLPYNSKLWGVKPEEMDIDWLHKIPSLNTTEILTACLVKVADSKKLPSHAGFYYPQKGGFQVIFDAISKYEIDNIMLNSPVFKLEYKDTYWIVNNEYCTKRIINTAPWPNIYIALGAPQNLANDFTKLMANSLVVSLWEKEYSHNYHWCYDPNLNLEHHREFFIHNFAPHSSKSGLYTETNLKRWPGENITWSNGSKPLFEYTNQFAYPIPILGHSKAIANILAYYSSKNLFGVGRWGQWQYLNADVCIRNAMKFVNEFF